MRGYLSEGRQQLERVLARGPSDETTPQRVSALLAAGTLAFRQGDYDGGAEHLQTSLERARTLGDNGASAAALRNLGRMAIDRGDFDEAARRACTKASTSSVR